jgi:hypothetical protein
MFVSGRSVQSFRVAVGSHRRRDGRCTTGCHGDDPEQGLSLVSADGEQDLRVPGRMPAATALELEERI